MRIFKFLFTLLAFCIISTTTLCAKSFYYKYLYTVDSDGMKRVDKFIAECWGSDIQPTYVFFSDNYSIITFGKKDSPYVWRLKYTKTNNGVFYYDKLYVPGLQPGQPSTIETASLAGDASGEMISFLINCCGQGRYGPTISFSGLDISHGYPHYVITNPRTPITILVKEDLSKINIVVHKSGDTIVLERSSLPNHNERRDLPNLIE